ncbi:MAG TPA: putative quinol monooxygenase [Candidatus Lokiarchaeia archaeon]|nr:putative quinol monooxygenase [Candidatus Lokiarchaeia archaeon]
MITLIGTFHVKEGKMDEFLQQMQDIVPVIRESEPGCLAYIPYTVQGGKNKNTVIFYERYDDKAAYDTHWANYPKYFVGKPSLVEGKPDIKICDEIV